MAKAQQNRFYIRVSHVETDEILERVRAAVAKVGRVWACARGTAKDPGSAWFEVEVKEKYLENIRAGLAEHGIDLWVEEAFAIERGEGRTQAKQLNLFVGAS